MNFHRHDEDGPPCKHMEGLLNKTADGSAKRLEKWYALAHAARCGRCGRFLRRLEQMLGTLKSVKREEPNPEVLNRLAGGAWRDGALKSEE